MSYSNQEPARKPRPRPVGVDELLLWLALDTRHDLKARHARVKRVFGLTRQPSDALHAARVALAGVMVNPHDCTKEGATQVTAALEVMRANGQLAQAAMCWRWLARYAWRVNAIEDAVQYARQALACREASVELRLSLTELLLPGLTQLLRFEEAEYVLEHEFLPLLDGANPGLAAGLAWVAVAFYRLECALRSGGVESEVTLDLDELTPCIDIAARTRMRPIIDQARAELKLAREAGGDDVVPAVRLTETLIAAFEGDLDLALAALGSRESSGASSPLLQHNRACFMRLNGRWQEALDVLMPEGRLVTIQGNLRVERANCLEVAISARALGRWELALGQERRYRQLLAIAKRNHLDSVVSGLMGHTHATDRVRPERELQLRRTLPPHVRRAVPLFEKTLTKRLSLAEMSAHVGVPERTLQDGLRRYLDASFTSMYRNSAMRVAAELLRLQTLSVAEVATRVGYQSLASFSREFRACHGRTPTEFRRSAP